MSNSLGSHERGPSNTKREAKERKCQESSCEPVWSTEMMWSWPLEKKRKKRSDRPSRSSLHLFYPLIPTGTFECLFLFFWHLPSISVIGARELEPSAHLRSLAHLHFPLSTIAMVRPRGSSVLGVDIRGDTSAPAMSTMNEVSPIEPTSPDLKVCGHETRRAHAPILT